MSAICNIYWFIVAPFVPVVFIYTLFHFIGFFYPSSTQHLFFLNFVKVPFVNYANLSQHGVQSKGRNFYIRGNDGVRLGCWHILPSSVSSKLDDISPSNMEQLMASGDEPIMIYLHGNAFDRARPHRCSMYNVLSNLGFHVLALDYRGYGDSTGFPTEVGVIQDVKELYGYSKKIAAGKKLYIWGHSMGTGVAIAAARELCDMKVVLSGLILEAPFNNLRDAIKHHWLSIPFRKLPWFEQIIIDPLEESGLKMSSDTSITSVKCPILILHAVDDEVLPLNLGRLLYEAARAANRQVTCIEFEATRELRHKYIYTAEELPFLIRHFITKYEHKME